MEEEAYEAEACEEEAEEAPRKTFKKKKMKANDHLSH